MITLGPPRPLDFKRGADLRSVIFGPVRLEDKSLACILPIFSGQLLGPSQFHLIHVSYNKSRET
jgi:hypothetical protein